MAQRRGRCQVTIRTLKAGKQAVKCGMPLDLDGNCPDHGKQK